MTKKEEAFKLLELIDPSQLNYEDWLNVGMGLESVGCTATDWENWSARDNRKGSYKVGECTRKWASFRGNGKGVSISTLAHFAKQQGHSVSFGDGGEWIAGGNDDEDLEIDSVIGGGSSKGDHKIVDENWIKESSVPPCPENWRPNDDLINYLLTLFKPDECVSYVMESFIPDGSDKALPTKGIWSKTRDQIIQELRTNGGAPLLGYNPKEGAWIRVNPLDGLGIKDDNVTDFRYALIESDDLSIGKQYTIIKELELPVATLVHSGGKSLHALVKIDAPTYEEYRKRVDFLYAVCKKNSFSIDKQNRNPSRLSRMAGIVRNGQPQYLIDTNIGHDSWDSWKDWIEDVNDNLPEMESLSDTWAKPPELSPVLIEGILRQGHKLLLAGPSKAGKSWNLIQLAVALAEGGWWNGWKCEQGKVLYVNLELDRPSCLNRFKIVYDELKIQNPNIQNIDVWNLRGKSAPMDKLAPKLIRRAIKKKYIAIIIDPIYKVITGDENSADQMANFCNQFDKICTELGSAVINCHHHSKGTQGNKKSADRSSGSGVFARDPDALIDLLPLQINKETFNLIKNKVVCDAITNFMRPRFPDWYETLSEDEQLVSEYMRLSAETEIGEASRELPDIINAAIKKAESISAWRIEGTLREFPSFPPRNMFFDYPTHKTDRQGILTDALAEGEETPYKRATPKERKAQKKEVAEVAKIDKQEEITRAFELIKTSEEPTTLATIAESIGIAERTVRRNMKDHPTLTIEKSIIKEL